jgi:formylglycine-generating enzyme required for sulfatase activity
MHDVGPTVVSFQKRRVESKAPSSLLWWVDAPSSGAWAQNSLSARFVTHTRGAGFIGVGSCLLLGLWMQREPGAFAHSAPQNADQDAGDAGQPTGRLNEALQDAGAQTTCPTGEVLIPPTSANGFTMLKDRKGSHRVVLTRPFCIDATEVTVAAYVKCVEAGVCHEPWRYDPYSMYPNHSDYPVNLVSWSKARMYCTWNSKRLPTEAEWEWAATGPDQRKYAWGNEPEPSCELADFTKYGAPKTQAGGDVGCHGGGPSPVGSHPKGDRLWGDGAVSDLAGNVWEWVEDSLSTFSDKDAAEPAVDPLIRNANSLMHPLRGGAWNRSYAGMEITFRASAVYNYQVPGVGFRCVRGAPHETEPPAHANKFDGFWKGGKK